MKIAIIALTAGILIISIYIHFVNDNKDEMSTEKNNTYTSTVYPLRPDTITLSDFTAR